MKFSIITTTFRKKESLVHAVNSLIAQTYRDWEIIIVNDSPNDTSYYEFAEAVNDPRIHYHVNERNSGENYSKNRALEKVSADSTWVLFLNDTDYLSPDALATFSMLIHTYPEQKWFVTNCALRDGTPLTHFSPDESMHSYLLSKMLTGKANEPMTHCIETKLIIHSKAQFSSYVKNGEAWFFLYQISLQTQLLYCDHNSTIVGDTFELKSKNVISFTKKYETLLQLFYEASRKKLLRFSLLLYLFLRSLSLFK